MFNRLIFFAILFPAITSSFAQIADDPQEAEILETARRPDSWFLEQVGDERIEMDGQTLDLRMQYRLQESYRAEAEARAQSSEHAQQTLADLFSDPESAAAIRAEANQEWIRQTRRGPELAWVRDEQVLSRNDEPMRVRVYRPDAQGVLPVLVYYHGGGWVIGNIEAVDRSLRLLADEAKVVIVSVDYRLAPENPYPASWDDAEDAFVWTVDNAERLGGESSGVCVGGDSAGGTMAAVVTSRRLNAEEPGPACQLLYYAAIDNRPVPEMRDDYLSARLFWQGFGLDVPFTEYVHQVVFPNENLSQPEISPLYADNIADMPPTLVVAAGFDPLRDSDRAYAAALATAGVSVFYLEYSSMRHGFLQHTAVTQTADDAARESARAFAGLVRKLPGKE